ncbi:sulfatase-like hydrolase/transferase [Lentisphaera profundi]|uniref:Sulfatase-like hydrolase/transferase n=1 Tax=Lentisphaera profundi TaxID=1658616 RepID=A0ABY7VY21_9BACT|nr:sulfatase-like hydrolase/transferase [Lentisphaera profundi]WDE97691.1 sulfatase-like hydrolase/transferase [Lentisphaera profundi]
MKKLTWLLAALLLNSTVYSASKPNIIIIMSDDSGYTDLGCYGGEIDTPNLDKMASNGLRFKNFYNNGRCSPTRASLMTGRDSAHAGFAAGTLGGWNREMKQPSYRARMPYTLPTIAELMKQSGYTTMMTGKWHLGGSLLKLNPGSQAWWKQTHPGWELTEEEIEADFNALPAQRGFDKFFGLIEGETHLFMTPEDKHEYLEGNQHTKLKYEQTYKMHCYYDDEQRYPYTANHGKTSKAFYATDGMTDRAIEMIEEALEDKSKPFFMYMAYRAPHLPIQAPQELVDKYLSRYDDLAKVEIDRVKGLAKQGLWDSNNKYRKHFSACRKAPEKYHLRAAIHAAMIEKIDQNVGKIIASLKKTGAFDNTLILYFSDNGAASHLGQLMNTPYFGCKALLYEGGTKTHCIAQWPKVIKKGSITESTGWVGDLLPTFLDIAGATYPKEFRGVATSPLDGRSILPILEGKTMSPPEYLFANDKGQQSVIFKGRWKLLIEPGWYVLTNKKPGISYELYDLQEDPAERINLANKQPEIVDQLRKVCAQWQQDNGILDYGELLKTRPNFSK